MDIAIRLARGCVRLVFVFAGILLVASVLLRIQETQEGRRTDEADRLQAIDALEKMERSER
jgi:hypothetical protein